MPEQDTLHMTCTAKRQNSSERGVVLVVAALLVLAIVGLVGLVVDAGRMQYIARQAQTAADAAALAGVLQLRDPSDPFQLRQGADVRGWRDVKKGVLAGLSQQNIFGLNGVAQQALLPANSGDLTAAFRFDDAGSSRTKDDCRCYNWQQAQRGNLQVRVTRGVFCYDASNVRRWYSLEGLDNHYCLANSIRLELAVSGVEATFARVFGVANLHTVRVFAAAHLNETNTCGRDQCESDLGIIDDGSGGFTMQPAFINPATGTPCMAPDPAYACPPLTLPSVGSCPL